MSLPHNPPRHHNSAPPSFRTALALALLVPAFLLALTVSLAGAQPAAASSPNRYYTSVLQQATPGTSNQNGNTGGNTTPNANPTADTGNTTNQNNGNTGSTGTTGGTAAAASSGSFPWWILIVAIILLLLIIGAFTWRGSTTTIARQSTTTSTGVTGVTGTTTNTTTTTAPQVPPAQRLPQLLLATICLRSSKRSTSLALQSCRYGDSNSIPVPAKPPNDPNTAPIRSLLIAPRLRLPCETRL